MTRKRRPGPGRPSKFTPEVQEQILAAIRAGNYLEVAAAHAGIGVSTLHRWMGEGAEDDEADPEKVRFREAVDRARATTEVRVAALVMKAVQGGYVIKETTRKYRDPATGQIVTETARDIAPVDGKLGLEYLARSHPDRWGRVNRAQLEVSGPGGGPVEVDASSAAALAARLVALREERSRELEAAADDVVVEAEVVD